MKAIERLYEYLSKKGISPNKFEKSTGLSQGYLSKMYNRRADMGESMLTSVLENCPELRAEWLIIGKGEMLQSSPENCPISVCPPDAEFYKALSEERKEEIQSKDKEIARLNILVGRYEERLTNFQPGKDTITAHGIPVSFDDTRDNTGTPPMQDLPLSTQGSSDPLSSHGTNPDE